jgi:hypothetical protein
MGLQERQQRFYREGEDASRLQASNEVLHKCLWNLQAGRNTIHMMIDEEYQLTVHVEMRLFTLVIANMSSQFAF